MKKTSKIGVWSCTETVVVTAILLFLFCASATSLIEQGKIIEENINRISKVILATATALGTIISMDKNDNIFSYALSNCTTIILLLFISIVVIDAEPCSFYMPILVLFGGIIGYIIKKQGKKQKNVRHIRGKNR